MPRSKDGVRRQLQQAALELYCERGYDQTTTAEIAARAGVTERTFFRHFPDKREVLFSDGEAMLLQALTTSVAEAPDTLGPLEILLRAFESVEQMLIDNWPIAEARHRVVSKSPALQERELAKVASLTAALATALRQRGIADRVAAFAAQAGMALFSYAGTCWRADPSAGLAFHLARAFDDLHALSSASTASVG